MGLGWFRELWRLPDYVRYANGQPNTGSSFTVKFIGEIVMGVAVGTLVVGAVPQEYEKWMVVPVLEVKVMDLLLPAAIAIGRSKA